MLNKWTGLQMFLFVFVCINNILCTCIDYYQGQALAMSLARANIETTVINDSAVFAIMSRVNKVIIGTHTVMANGG